MDGAFEMTSTRPSFLTGIRSHDPISFARRMI